MFEYILRMLAFSVGTGFSLVLSVTLLVKRKPVLRDRLTAATAILTTLWFGAQALDVYIRALLRTTTHEFDIVVATAGAFGGYVALAALLHLTVIWSGWKGWIGALGYASAFLAWILSSRTANVWLVYSMGCLVLAAAASFHASAVTQSAPDARFHRLFAVSLLLVPAGRLAGPDSASFAVATLLPVTCAVWHIYRYNLFDILIGRRTMFAFTLAVVSAAYLFLVRRIADFVEERFDVFGAVVEVSLIFGAAVLWLPLYEWITRYLSRRSERYAEFCKDIVERAVKVLDVGSRLQFLAEEVARVFEVRRVLLYKSSPLKQHAAYHCDVTPALLSDIEFLLNSVLVARRELIHVLRTVNPSDREILERTGFNYAFPLWYEENLTGILMVDTSPRLFLDENEPILLSMSRQISHSIEACRLVEDKISLEKALLRQEHLASLGQVAATIAHEVKNPLSSIKTLAQLMREDSEMDDRYHRDLNFIVSETDRLNHCVGQLLSFSRPLPTETATVSIFELLELTAGTLKREAAERRVLIEYHVEPELQAYRSDRQALQQVVLNLAINAVQASSEGGTVTLRAGVVAPETVRIEVTDEGPGIAAEVRQKIFEPFFTTKQRGSGLGLAIVKKNLRYLRGEIHVVSPVSNGKGTCFTVSFPVSST